ncbi:MAG: phosphatidylglycerophosphatase A family protein [Candidatus Methylomirabilaceae bacterium]
MVSRQRSRAQTVLARACLLIATGFHLGRAPRAPGTLGSLAALIAFLPFRSLPWAVHLPVVALLLALGVFAAGRAEAALGAKDPPVVIIDEMVGCWVALVGIPPSFPPLVCAFALFRLFDIWKPFPADRAERLPGGWGIMLDDLVAAAYANLSVRLFWG